MWPVLVSMGRFRGLLGIVTATGPDTHRIPAFTRRHTMAPRRGSFSEASGVLAAVSRFYRRTYGPDYVALAGLVAAYVCIVIFVEPFHRMFSISDLAVSFPHAEAERVPVLMNVVYAGLAPLAAVALTNCISGASAHKHHVALLGLLVGLAVTTLVTDVVKNAVGRPRPDLLARCKPAAGTPRDVLVDWTVCTETAHHLLHDGWRSFPSGHSSFSFAGLGYTALFLAGQLRVFSARGLDGGNGNDDDATVVAERTVQAHAGNDLGRALLCLAPVLGAAMIAISRCQDYRHDVYDVCTGALLGSVVAYWSYRRYWPRLTSGRSDEPYPSPDGAYGRLRDVEAGRNMR
ncbi:hypothetical protein RB601_005833 [Gaeumannomyces tritici]